MDSFNKREIKANLKNITIIVVNIAQDAIIYNDPLRL